jgi:hypothetical protein
MRRKPIKVILKGDPTPEELAAAEALANQTGWPATMCRAALEYADGDAAQAAACFADWQFIVANTDYSDPAALKMADAFCRRRGKEMARRVPPAVKARGLDAQWATPARMDEWDQRAEQAKGTKLEDPVFGALKWDDMWEGKGTVPPFGEVDVTVETDDTVDAIATPPPDDQQRAALKAFVAAADTLYPAVEQANFRYFRDMSSTYAEPMEAAHVPDVRSAADLWKELGRTTIHVPPQAGGAWRVQLNWGCTWDPEHGHAVFIEGGKIVHVGQQGDGWPE